MRYRIQFSRLAEARFVSHLDTMKAVERAMRRARIPIAFSEGFNPHPKFSFGSALAVGVTSEKEYLDLELQQEWEPARLLKTLSANMPGGYRLSEVKVLAPEAPAAMSIINQADYLVRFKPSRTVTQEQLEQLVTDFLARPEIIVEKNTKKGKRQADLRPGIFTLSAQLQNPYIILRMHLQSGSTGNIRPEDVVSALSAQGNLDVDVITAQIHRLGLYVSKNDQLLTPMNI
ncbi:MAG TPA: TIGR03936 family radical SAM-associated protein [Bacillota bacterium]|nr:TIGR03936 family radical SAM-associated protein [Bacillota bacterium]